VQNYEGGKHWFASDIVLKCRPYVRALVAKIERRQTQDFIQADREDLWQSGDIGVYKALLLYNSEHSSGARFTSYAKWWIHREVFRCLRAQRFMVTIPDNMHDQLAELARVMTQPDADQLTDQEVAKLIGVKLQRHLNLKQAQRFKTILMQWSGASNRSDSDPDEDSHNVFDQIAGGADPQVELLQKEIEEERSELLEQLLGELEPVERKVIRASFGLDSGCALKLPELAQTMQKSVAELKVIKNRALRKMKRIYNS
jgi:RNA polymerase primary sigma factor